MTEIKRQDDLELPNATRMLVSLCAVNLFANSAYSSIAPFLPIEAESKGVPTWAFGSIFSAYSAAMFLFSPLFALMLNKYPAKKVLILGCICEGISMLVFGFFDYIDDPKSYAIACFFCRFLEGFGNGCLNSSCKSQLTD